MKNFFRRRFSFKTVKLTRNEENKKKFSTFTVKQSLYLMKKKRKKSSYFLDFIFQRILFGRRY
jgi:hypothetical protein